MILGGEIEKIFTSKAVLKISWNLNVISRADLDMHAHRFVIYSVDMSNLTYRNRFLCDLDNRGWEIEKRFISRVALEIMLLPECICGVVVVSWVYMCCFLSVHVLLFPECTCGGGVVVVSWVYMCCCCCFLSVHVVVLFLFPECTCGVGVAWVYMWCCCCCCLSVQKTVHVVAGRRSYAVSTWCCSWFGSRPS